MTQPPGSTGWPPPLMTRVTALFGIRYPIIQAGMVWAAGSKLAVAVSQAGGLGLIGAGSMKPDVLKEHLRAARALVDQGVGVNIPLQRGDAAELVRVALGEGMRIVFTSAGHPVKFTGELKAAGCFVVHVVSSVKQAQKACDAGCDAVVAEGFEAGGHNGPNETTTMTLVPQVVDAVSIPVIAAGGIADGRGMAAALSLGAEGVQVGTRFAATLESSAHERYKTAVLKADDGSTILTMKKIAPVRMIKNPFVERVLEAERAGAGKDDLLTLMGKNREQGGIFEGDLEEGMLEAGQSAGLVHDVPAAGEIVRRMMEEYGRTRDRLP